MDAGLAFLICPLLDLPAQPRLPATGAPATPAPGQARPSVPGAGPGTRSQLPAHPGMSVGSVAPATVQHSLGGCSSRPAERPAPSLAPQEPWDSFCVSPAPQPQTQMQPCRARGPGPWRQRPRPSGVEVSASACGWVAAAGCKSATLFTDSRAPACGS